MAEGALHVIDQVGETELSDVDDDRAGLDLREIENVVDQVQEVLARGVDRLRELGLFAGQVTVGVAGKLIGQDQEAVQRRPQLVRHVGQELRLVLRRQRQLLRLLFERDPRLLDLLVLALHLDVALGQQRGFLLELLVGLAELLLLALEFSG